MQMYKHVYVWVFMCKKFYILFICAFYYFVNLSYILFNISGECTKFHVS
jgi:hypothetical protein